MRPTQSKPEAPRWSPSQSGPAPGFNLLHPPIFRLSLRTPLLLCFDAMLKPRSLVAPARSLRCVARAAALSSTPSTFARRSYSTPAGPGGSLPLEGYRVLDMTRVLAGVCSITYAAPFGILLLTWHAALLHSDPWRPGVCTCIHLGFSYTNCLAERKSSRLSIL
jgi:hypothetical protein